VNTLGVLKPEVKARALRLWLNGLTYRTINERTGVSLGAMNELVNEARKKTSDIDDLRQLNVGLQKSGASVSDAARGAKLLDKINVLGMSLERLEGLIGIVDRICADRNVEADKFVDSALRLTELEIKTGKPYHEIVREFKDKQARVNELDLKVKELDSQRANIQWELSQATEKLSKTLQELKHTLGTKERLQRLGVEKTATLAEFVEDYELLGFSVEEVQEIAELKKELDAEGIRLGTLRQHFKSTRELKQKREVLKREIESWEAKLRVFSKMGREMERTVNDLQRIQYLMNMRKAFTCGYCGSQFFHELRRFEVSQCLAMRQPIIVNCQRCGAPNTYNPHEVLARLGFEVLS